MRNYSHIVQRHRETLVTPTNSHNGPSEMNVVNATATAASGVRFLAVSDVCLQDWQKIQSLPVIEKQAGLQDALLTACVGEAVPTPDDPDSVFCDARVEALRDPCAAVGGRVVDVYWELLGSKYVESVFSQCVPTSCATSADDLNGILWSWAHFTFCEGPYWRTGAETACCNVNYYLRVTEENNGGHHRRQCHPTESVTGAVVCDSLYLAQACCYSEAGCPGVLWGCDERWGYPCPYAACLPNGPTSQWIGRRGRYFLFTDWTGEPVYLDVKDNDGWVLHYYERDCERNGAQEYSTSCAGKDANGVGLGTGVSFRGRGFENDKGPGDGGNGFLFVGYSTTQIGTETKTLFDTYDYYYVCHYLEQPYTFGRDPTTDETSSPKDMFAPVVDEGVRSESASVRKAVKICRELRFVTSVVTLVLLASCFVR